ncbi:pyridoxal phosphate-dependent aminotransferase [Clostridium pasteurianum]|uniref:PLP-dependent enzyme, histidinol-phosphate/aromatic aminotransferase or cobyric acid decarboxylase n=1 Tax=Clostridium pasteurianum BC1 TaxID=86416 RepID=R4K0V3_CLOPA|nr:histidinol-phosphate transaminase [Clostridium pasteurianum]AGK96198.1 PLP-dependent enzyme, histidinol-phosphate/aromatic aminotransferase or cobyric acid decarboxylase [Clostridium pasteurianum BC1]
MIHGGDIYTDGIFKGQELLDFSSNINPLGVPEGFKNNIAEALDSVTRYPDIKYREVIKNLSDYTGTAEENFVLGNGAAEIIDLVISNFKSILIVVPSFVEYEINAKKWGCHIEYSKLLDNMDFDYEDIENKLNDVEAVIVGNPNNPNGNIIDKVKVETIIEICEAKNKTIIMDEAFIEFTGRIKNSFLDKIEDNKCIFIIRAITKFFAMPGVRFGYGISSNKVLLNNIRKKQNPWNINCFAELAVKYSLKDKEYIKKSLQWIEEEREFFVKQLNEIPFIEQIFKSFSNFVLCKLRNVNEEKLYEYCLENGIIIRKTSNFRGLDKSYVRFAIKDRESNEKLIKILKDSSF